MAVDVHGDADLGVAKEFHEHSGRYATYDRRVVARLIEQVSKPSRPLCQHGNYGDMGITGGIASSTCLTDDLGKQW